MSAMQPYNRIYRFNLSILLLAIVIYSAILALASTFSSGVLISTLLGTSIGVMHGMRCGSWFAALFAIPLTHIIISTQHFLPMMTHAIIFSVKYYHLPNLIDAFVFSAGCSSLLSLSMCRDMNTDAPTRIQQRLLAIIAAMFVLISACSLVIKSINTAALRQYREYVESEYHGEIELIERLSKELPNPNSTSNTAVIREEVILEELEHALSKREIFYASWSRSKTHHQMKGLKPMDTNGYRTYMGYCSSRDRSGLHALYLGATFQGHSLLEYVGSVPTGVNKSYRIAFYLDDIVRQIDQKRQGGRY